MVAMFWIMTNSSMNTEAMTREKTNLVLRLIRRGTEENQHHLALQKWDAPTNPMHVDLEPHVSTNI